MKRTSSLIICWFIFFSLVFTRTVVPQFTAQKQLKVTTWDAFGYYLYLPAIFIYHDYKKLDWLAEKDKQYALTGGNGWQAIKETNGNYVFKYLGGVALLELPLFLVGHISAKVFHYPQDGFSVPYQYALAYGILIYCLVALLILRKVLLHYFNDFVVAFTLLFLCLATNFIQYAAVDGAQSHAYIFLLYCVLLFVTIKWHQQPTRLWAALTGLIIGVGMICRPTEAIMILIPLLWHTQNKTVAKGKWSLVGSNKLHVFIALVFGLIGVLPQLIYWKLSSGSIIYDVGSKWQFLNPWFRVLFGWEKGWFVYTPITLFFVIGIFFMQNVSFKKSIGWYCLLNIWIVISWSDWHYGGSYSTRALVQSYPVFALPFATVIEKITRSKWKVAFYLLAGILLFINLFQVWQYNQGVLLDDGMNLPYYQHVFLKKSPTALDYSLIDHQEFLANEKEYSTEIIATNTQAQTIQSNHPFLKQTINYKNREDCWLKINATIQAQGHLWSNYLNATITNGKQIKEVSVRLFRPLANEMLANDYSFYLKLPKLLQSVTLTLFIKSNENFTGVVSSSSILLFVKRQTKHHLNQSQDK